MFDTALERFRKVKSSGEAASIKLRTDRPGRLRPVHGPDPTAADVRYLTHWRNLHANAFLAEFSATEGRTTAWLRTQVHPDDTRIIFMLELAGDIVGYVGLAGIDWKERSFELDGIVRGRADAPPGTMTAAVRAMMEWARQTLQLSRAQVRVRADNPRAVTFYTRLGFVETGRVPLRRVERDGEAIWIEDATLPTSAVTLIHMTQSCDALFESGPRFGVRVSMCSG